jgi:signal transduction histidine kinase
MILVYPCSTCFINLFVVRLFLIITVWAIFLGGSHAVGSSLQLSNDVQTYNNVGPFVGYKVSDESIDQCIRLESLPYTYGADEVINLGFQKKSVWFKLVINNRSVKDSLWRLMLTYPLLDRVEFYQEDNGQIKNRLLTGELFHSTYTVSGFVFPFSVAPLRSTTIYIRVQTQGGVLMPLSIASASVSSSSFSRYSQIYGAFFGAILVMGLFNLLLFIQLKDIGFLFYSAFIWFQGLVHFMYTGHHLIYLPLSVHTYSNALLIFLMYSTNVFSLFFTLRFLGVKYMSNWLKYSLRGLLGASLLGLCLQFLIPYYYSAQFLSLLYIITPIMIFIAGFLGLLKGQIYARYFILAWFVFIISIVSLSLRTLGLLPGHYPLDVMVQLGSVIDVIMLGFALAERYKVYRDERNMLLEEKINQSKLTIHQQSDQLQNAYDKIEIQNQKLLNYNQTLEEDVQKRTKELNQAIYELQHHVKTLEQYSYVVSHNLRSPVATILGLVGLLKRETLNEQAQQSFAYIEKTALNLDLTINELSGVLELRGQLLEFQSLTDEFVELYQHKLEALSAKLQIDFSAASAVTTFRFSIRNILFSLLDNAVKFNDPSRVLEIQVVSKKQQDRILLIVKDNGKGIDLTSLGDKLFKLYQRFDLEIEGRGLGLYMAKKQVEYIRGSIEVYSVVGQGSEFIVAIPIG